MAQPVKQPAFIGGEPILLNTEKQGIGVGPVMRLRSLTAATEDAPAKKLRTIKDASLLPAMK